MRGRAPACPRARAPVHGRVPICPRVRMSARPIKRSCSETARKWPRNRVLAQNTRRCAPFARPPPISANIMPGHDKRSRPFRNGPVPELGFVAKIGRQTNMRDDTKKARSLHPSRRRGFGVPRRGRERGSGAGSHPDASASPGASPSANANTRPNADPSATPGREPKLPRTSTTHDVRRSKRTPRRTPKRNPSAHPDLHPNANPGASPSANASARPDARPTAHPDATGRSPEKRTYAFLKNAS